MKDIYEKKTDLEFAEAQVRADGERPIRVEGQESQTDALSVRDTSQDDLALLSPYTLEHDEARIAALDDACGVNDEECR